jgi:hypothetical protein
VSKKYTPKETEDSQRLIEEISIHGYLVLTVLDDHGRTQYQLCVSSEGQKLTTVGTLTDQQIRLLERDNRIHPVKFISDRFPRQSLRVII